MGESVAPAALLMVSALLHLHLEPEDRKRRLLGAKVSSPTTPEQFFVSHALDRADRFRVDLRDLRRFLEDVVGEQREQQVDYVELRVSPARWVRDCGLALSAVLSEFDQTLSDLNDSTIKLILLVNRKLDCEALEDYEAAIIGGLPPRFVGIDIAGDERRFPDVEKFHQLTAAARAAGLGLTVHAGEFGGVEHVWRAIDTLGAARVAHALSAPSDTTIIRRMAADDILVEVSMGSNLKLGAWVPDDPHPAMCLLEYGVPVCFNTDLPILTGLNLEYELLLASKLLHVEMRTVTWMQQEARRYGFH